MAPAARTSRTTKIIWVIPTTGTSGKVPAVHGINPNSGLDSYNKTVKDHPAHPNIWYRLVCASPDRVAPWSGRDRAASTLADGWLRLKAREV